MAVNSQRKALGKKVRFEVFKRDSFSCQYCGASPPKALLQVDHINPVALGGDNSIDNLITACFECNIGKGAKPLNSVPQSLADKAKDIKEREEQLAGYKAIMEEHLQRLDEDTWRVLWILYPDQDTVLKNEYRTVQMFIERLGLYETIECAEIASAAGIYKTRIFRYFCGCCWRMIREAEA